MRVFCRFSTGSSSGRLGLIVKSLGMTAARVELGRLLPKLSSRRVSAGKVRGLGIALARLNKHMSRKKGCLENSPIV